MNTPPLISAGTLLLVLLGCSGGTDPPTAPGSADARSPELAVASNSWITRRDLWSNQKGDFATAVVPNASGQSILYVIGGRSDLPSLGKVMAYNAATNRWAVKASLPVSLRESNGAGVIGGKIYVSGGISRTYSWYGRLYMYDPETNVWTRKSDVPTEGFGGLTGVIDDKLYVVTSCHSQDEPPCGWQFPGHPDRWLFRYDPRTDTWTERAIPPARPYTHVIGGTIGGKLYMGTYASSILDVYDPDTDRWTERVTTRAVRLGAVSATLAGKLYMIGGYRGNVEDGFTAVRTTHVYDPTTNAWTDLARLPTARAYGGAARVFVNGKARIEVVGGTRPGNNIQYIP